MQNTHKAGLAVVLARSPCQAPCLDTLAVFETLACEVELPVGGVVACVAVEQAVVLEEDPMDHSPQTYWWTAHRWRATLSYRTGCKRSVPSRTVMDRERVDPLAL